MGLSSLVANHAKARPHHPAIEDGDRIFTYGELQQASSTVAANLWDAGIRPGDLVAISLPNSADHLIALWGLVRLGAIIWPLDTGLYAETLNTHLVEHKAAAFIGQVALNATPNTSLFSLTDITKANLSEFVQPELDDGAPFALIQSSGTTGTPKYVYWSRRQLMDILDAPNPTQHWTDNGRCVCFVNMCLNSSCRYHLRFLLAGATVIVNHATTVEEMAELVNEKRVSWMNVIPAQLQALINSAQNEPLLFPHEPTVVTYSGGMSQERLLLARQKVTPNINQIYGTNECGLAAITTPEDQDAFPGTSGRLLSGFDGEIVDEDDAILPPNHVGLLRIKGANFPTTYVNNPEATKHQFKNGWYYPGDLAALNEKGYLFLKGRADDVISKSGVKFYPIEVERVLLAFPGVTEAAVFAWPHPTYGEVAAACITIEPGVSVDDVANFCAQHLANYKRPRHLMVVKTMPKNAMGKIIKGELKERLRINNRKLKSESDG